ncbi:MAG TPA: L,D-transpeptidase family protein [Terriglobia bacterium]|nr:L,D-transpeptidase family protein [Candidatus Acidoferrum sp.]HMD85329.1 L,D-transpeptidase family protein [Terriglobia bacterium]
MLNRLASRVFLLLLLLMMGCKHGPDAALGSVAPQASSTGDAEPLGPEGQASLHAILETGNLPDLRWPDFSDYREDVAKFYEGYGDALPWVRGMQATPQAQAMIGVLQSAGEKGLSADDYDGSRWAARLARLKPAARDPKEPDLVSFDVALTVSAMRYISDLHIGRVNPERLHFAIDVAERRYNLAEFLREHVVHGSSVPAILQQVEPPYPGYQRMIRALGRYREIARQDDGETLPAIKKPIRPGDSYSEVPRLVRLLRLVGDLPEDAALRADNTVYQGALVNAVKSFQQRHGLTPDGQIDGQTIAELNVPLSRRMRQMELTLERWRWLPDEYQHSPVVVNIPEFRLRAYDDQFKIAVTMKVVVGKAYGHSTPIFTNKMRYVIFRPYWNVPPSIARAETIPSIERNPNYLTKENMEVVDNHENVVSSGAVTDEMLQEVREGKLSVRQRPGPKNSLGLIKFMFPNEYDVYMHDTPATELFSRSRRDFSHGCIRLEKPVDLAVWVLRDNPGWDVDHILAAMNGSKTEEVTLAHPIPVLIVYGTVTVSEDGTVHFYEDIYRHDAALEQALEKGYPYPR